MKQKVQSVRRLPRIKIEMSQFMNYADQEGRVAMESDIPGLAYVSVENEGTAIVTGDRGYLIVMQDDIPTLLDELSEVFDHMMRRKHR